MNSSPKVLKLVATIELFTGVIFIFLAVIMYLTGEKIGNPSDEVSVTFIFMVIGLISLLSSPILFFVAKRAEERSNTQAE